MRTTGSGTAVTSFNIAVNSGWGDKQETAFVPITTWGKVAENCHQYLEKGRKVAVTGRLTTGSYEKDGRTVYTWDVTAVNVEFLGGNEKAKSDDNNEEIPF